MNLGRTATRRAGRLLVLALTLAGVAGCGGGGGTSPSVPLQADLAASPPAGPAPIRVQFTDLSRGAVTSWSWDFGDGDTSHERNPRHIYVLPGVYDVSLSVTTPQQSSSARRAGLVQVAPPLQSALEYGMNPSFQRWSSREIVFADAMMRASEFMIVRGAEVSQDPAPVFPLGRNPPRLGEGWPDLSALGPGETAGAWLFGAMEGSLPDGRVEPYVLTWEGTGSCQLVGTAVISQLQRTARRAEVRIDPEIGAGNGTVGLWIDSSSRVDPVRNVHVWLPGTSTAKPLFWPAYLARAQALNLGHGPACWRTLDWTRVNDYGANDPPLPFEFDLAGTIRPTSPSQGTRRGMCPEFQVAFCNAVGADLHFQVPHRAEPLSPADYDTFLRDAFTRIRDGAPAVPGINGGAPFDGLAPECGLTIELSNELWNAGFPAGRWFLRQAAARGVSVHEAIADELVHVWSLADEVFAGRRTVRRFIGGFVAESDFVQRILAALPPGTRVDALGPSCYFRPRPDVVDGWLAGASADLCPRCPTPEQVIAAARLSIDELRAKLAEHRAVADAYTNPDGSHPRLELYEAGQSFDAGLQPWGEAAREAQVLPEMYYAFIDDLIPMLVDSGVDAVDWYSFMTDQDPSHGVSVGFGIWNDMNQSITLPVPEPYRDEGAPKAAAIYRGPPQR